VRLWLAALWLLGVGTAQAADMIALRQTMITLRYVDQIR
jgi:hypothetical protein